MKSPHVLTVSRLADLLKEVVEDNFFQVLVEGEISNFSSPGSGHLYFCLKDERAQIRAVMFRTRNRLLPFRPENGMHVLCGGRLSLYSQRGEIQLVVETLEPLGLGSLQLAFEQLKEKLAAEGLFREDLKQSLPPHPVTIGVVTSPTGAAIHDILHVLRRRGAGLRLLLRPVRVQGEGAADEIAEAIADLNRQGEADVLIVGRGGGSLEDLWAFNEEAVARAIRASALPVISAVGHETDVTIADFAADLRAPTPSAAAEMVARSRLELEGHLDHLILRLDGQIRGRIGLWRERLSGQERRLRNPLERLEGLGQRRNYLEQRLFQAFDRNRSHAQGQLATLSGRLDNLSPLRILSRGYAVVRRERDGLAVRNSSELKVGEGLDIRFSEGSVRAEVAEVKS